MHITNVLKKTWVCTVLLTGLTATQGQTVFTAVYIGPSSGGDWNTAGNWSTAVVPGADPNGTTNAVILGATNVNYNSAMVAGNGFGVLTNQGTLNVNAVGFTNTGIVMTFTNAGSSGKLFVNNGGAVKVNGNLGLCSNSIVSMAAGSSITISGALNIGSDALGGSGGVATVGACGSFTNVGGFLTVGSVNMNPKNASIGQSCRLIIEGGTNNLGAVNMQRSPGGNSAPPALGSDGLIISNGIVNTTSIGIGNNAHGVMYLVGGIVTNAGTLTLRNGTATRPARFIQTGGLFVDPDPSLMIESGTADCAFSVLGGTNILGGIQFNATTDFFTNAANVYIGSAGISTNGAQATAITACLNNGGLFGATANWVSSVPLRVNTGSSGLFTFLTADPAGNPFNIQIANVLSGSSGNVSKTGGGTLILSGTNTYTGNLLVNSGTVLLDVNGSLASSKIIVGSSGVFDVSTASAGLIVNNNQTLSGGGVVTGAVAVVSGGTIDPGSNTLTGTLTILGSVTETNGSAVNHFDLTGAPNPNNDLIVITGDFNVGTATNKIDINGASLTSGASYVLIQYGGNFDGTTNNFQITTASGGLLTNDTVAKTISYVAPAATLRGATNTVWIGNPVNTNWDYATSTNWLNASSGALDIFVQHDNVQFIDAGASNSPVNIVGVVQPDSILVNSHSNYVFASTVGGSIGGTGSLTVTNTGMLTIAMPTNSYAGNTTIDGGSTLVVSQVSNAGSPSPIGEGSLIINNGTFSYTGANSSVNLGPTLGTAASAINVSTNGNLTLSGNLTGGGGLTKIGNGTLILSSANNYGGGTLVNAGTLTLNNDPNAAGTGIITLNGGILAIGAIKPQNTVTVVVASVVQGGNNGGLTGIRNVTGSADLTIAVGTQTNSVFDLTGDMTAFSGTVTCSNNDTGIAVVRFNGSTGSALATWDLGVGPVMDLNVRTSSSLEQLGALKGAAGTTLSGRGGSSNSGGTTYAIGANGQNTTFNGVIQNGFGASGSVPNANSPTSVTKVGSGTLSLTGTSTYTGNTTVSNGVLALVSSGSIGDSAIINIISGASIDVSGRGDGTLSLATGQQLRGRGTIVGSLNSSGIVSPGGGTGGGIGTLTATNSISLSGVTWMKLNRTNSPNCDRLVSSLSSVNYGGTLITTNIGDTLQVGDTFTLFSGTSLNGSFSSILPASYRWDTSHLNVNGSITFQGYIKFAITNIDISDLVNGNISISGTNGPYNGSVNVLTSTNLALPLSQWTTNITGLPLYPDGSLHPSDGTFQVDPTLPQLFILVQPQ